MARSSKAPKPPKIFETFTKPLLAEDIEDVNDLTYPLLAGLKRDGFRGINKDGVGLTRRFKPIANNFTREWVAKHIPHGMEGEMTIAGKDFNACQSAFSTVDGEPNFLFNAFDWFDPRLTYFQRYCKLLEFWQVVKDKPGYERFNVIEHVWIKSPEELVAFKEASRSIPGLDGIITRKPDGLYKCGRSTLNEQLLLRWKDWADSEAVILDVREQMRNENEATIDELGHTKRSTHKENMVPAGTFGSFWVRDLKTGKEFSCGGGEDLDHATRLNWWGCKEQLIGKVITYKYMTAGMKDLPRFPQWKGFRDRNDFDE